MYCVTSRSHTLNICLDSRAAGQQLHKVYGKHGSQDGAAGDHPTSGLGYGGAWLSL